MMVKTEYITTKSQNSVFISYEWDGNGKYEAGGILVTWCEGGREIINARLRQVNGQVLDKQIDTR